MGKRGKGAKPVLVSDRDSRQAGFGFVEGQLSPLRKILPWEEPGLNRLERVIAFLEDLPITQGSLAGTKLKVRDWQRDFLAEVYAEDGGPSTNPKSYPFNGAQERQNPTRCRIGDLSLDGARG